jgi:hypothetical protein
VADKDVLDRVDVTEDTVLEPSVSVVEVDSDGRDEVDDTREALCEVPITVDEAESMIPDGPLLFEDASTLVVWDSSEVAELVGGDCVKVNACVVVVPPGKVVDDSD